MSKQVSSTNPPEEQLQGIWEFTKILRVRLGLFSLAVLFSIAGIAFNLSGLQLLIPLAQGLIRNDFSHVRDGLGLIEKAENHFPAFFQNPHLAFFPLATIVLMLVFIQNIFDYYSALFVTRETKHAERNLRSALFARYLTFGKFFFDRNATPEIFNTLTQHVSSIAGQVKSYHRIVTQLLSFVAIFSWLLFISWKLTVVAIFILPLHQLLSRTVIDKLRHKIRESEKSLANIRLRLFNLITCIPLMKISAAEKEETLIFEKESFRETESALYVDKQALLIKPVEDFSMFITLILIAAAMSFIRAKDTSTDISLYLVFFFTIQQLLARIGVFNEFKVQQARTASAWAQIKKAFSPEGKAIIPAGTKPFHSLLSGISIRGLTFCYFPDRPILKNLNIEIESAKVTAIVGPTGAGKTTLFSLLLRLYDCPAQSIFMDSVDIREIETGALLEKIACVSQDILLFNESLRFNLVYGLKRSCSDADLWEALKIARIDEFIKNLPGKLDTPVGERGVRFSGGEKQRLSIARAILKKADILLLDEATSSLDAKTERQIQETLAEITRGKTTVMVTHRLSAVLHADKIIVLQNGEAREQGTLQELLASGGEFAKQWYAQNLPDLKTAKL